MDPYKPPAAPVHDSFEWVTSRCIRATTFWIATSVITGFGTLVSAQTLSAHVDVEWFALYALVITALVAFGLRELWRQRAFRPSPWLTWPASMAFGLTVLAVLMGNRHGYVDFPPGFAVAPLFVASLCMLVAVLHVQRTRPVDVYMDVVGTVFVPRDNA